MAESSFLQDRVAKAVEEIERIDAERRRCNVDLKRMLARLEERFNARSLELEHLRDRIGALTEANGEIERFLDRLAALSERHAAWVGESGAALKLRLDGAMLAETALTAPGGEPRFEDVDPAELEAEDLGDAIPEIVDVRQACAV